MSDLSWFDVSRYDSCEQWTSDQWARAIELRNYMTFLTTKQGQIQVNWFLGEELGDKLGTPGRAFTDEDRKQYWRRRIRYLHEYGTINKRDINATGYSLCTVHPVTIEHLAVIYSGVTLDYSPEQLSGYVGDCPQSDELKAHLGGTVEDAYVRKGFSPEMWGESMLLSVSLDSPDEALVEHFLDRIRAARKKYGIAAADKVPDASHFAKWHQARILGYFDLSLYKKTQGLQLTDQQIGLALFPGEFEVSLAERIRKTTKKWATEVFTDTTLAALQSSK